MHGEESKGEKRSLIESEYASTDGHPVCRLDEFSSALSSEISSLESLPVDYVCQTFDVAF